MLKSIILYLLFTVSTVVIERQDLNIRGVVCNRVTREPIPYATIQKLSSKVFKDANELGQFEISATVNDSLIVTSIGFGAVRMRVPPEGALDSVFLNPNITLSPEITVSKPTLETFGFVNEKTDRSCSGGEEITRYEVATLIEMPETVGFYRISKILIKGRGFGSNNPLRLHIYAVDNNGLPGKELLSKDIVITSKDDKRNINTVELKDQNIFIEEGAFFVGLQWLGTQKQRTFIGPELYETFRKDKLFTYRRNLGRNNDKWYGWYDKSIVFFPGGVVPEKAVPINVVASAEIEVFDRGK